MKCPKCGSENVEVQMVSDVKEKRKKGFWYWVFLWWWELILWVVLTIPKIFIAIFGRKTKVVTKIRKIAVCQDCGHSWKV